MTKLHTPRAVLQEMVGGKRRPWWADRLAKRIEIHLAITLWKGKPLIDTPMSAAMAEAVIDEALNVVRMPDPGDPVGEMLYDMAPRGNA